MSRKLIQYGGALFTADCPVCGEDLEAPKSLSVNKFMSQSGSGEKPSTQGTCKRCGRQDMAFVRFTKAVA